jgi:site-specific DNA recombinase
VPAAEIEALVLDVIQRSARDGEALPQETGEADDGSLIERELERVVIRSGAVEVWRVERDGADPQSVGVPWRPRPSRRERAIMLPLGATENSRPIRAETRARLVEGIAKARRWLDELVMGTVTDTGQIAKGEGCSERSVRMTLNLAFLAPEIMKAAVEGSLPHGVGITSLADTPLCWRTQCACLLQPTGRAADS